MDRYQEFIEWMEAGVKAKGVPFYAVAQAIGVSRQYVSDIVNGNRTPSRRIILALAEYFGESPEFPLLLGGFLPPSLEGVTHDEFQLMVRYLDFVRSQGGPKEFLTVTLEGWPAPIQPANPGAERIVWTRGGYREV